MYYFPWGLPCLKFDISKFKCRKFCFNKIKLTKSFDSFQSHKWLGWPLLGEVRKDFEKLFSILNSVHLLVRSSSVIPPGELRSSLYSLSLLTILSPLTSPVIADHKLSHPSQGVIASSAIVLTSSLPGDSGRGRGVFTLNVYTDCTHCPLYNIQTEFYKIAWAAVLDWSWRG